MANPLDTDVGSELFEEYERDLKLVFADITSQLDQINDLSGEPRRSKLGSLERAIDEAEELLGQMKIEIGNIPTATRQKLNPRIRNYAQDIDNHKRAIKRIGQEMDRHALFNGRTGGVGGTTGDVVNDQRQQLLGGTERLERSSQRLRDSHRIASETERIGGDILVTLGGQREQIENTQRMLHQSEGYVDKSIKTLRGMARRMATNRIITIAIITVLVLLILAVIASKFR